MSLKIEELKKKIIYRSSYRGIKEMDILLKSFVMENIDKLNSEELIKLHNFLDIDDDNLYKYINDLETEIKIPDNRISQLFKKFSINK